jgi:hypothetical protein
VIVTPADHDEPPELSVTQRDDLLRLLRDELDQAYPGLDLPPHDVMADLRRRRARLDPPAVRPGHGLRHRADHRAIGDVEVDNAQDGDDNAVHRPAIGE